MCRSTHRGITCKMLVLFKIPVCISASVQFMSMHTCYKHTCQCTHQVDAAVVKSQDQTRWCFKAQPGEEHPPSDCGQSLQAAMLNAAVVDHLQFQGKTTRCTNPWTGFLIKTVQSAWNQSGAEQKKSESHTLCTRQHLYTNMLTTKFTWLVPSHKPIDRKLYNLGISKTMKHYILDIYSNTYRNLSLQNFQALGFHVLKQDHQPHPCTYSSQKIDTEINWISMSSYMYLITVHQHCGLHICNNQCLWSMDRGLCEIWMSSKMLCGCMHGQMSACTGQDVCRMQPAQVFHAPKKICECMAASIGWQTLMLSCRCCV